MVFMIESESPAMRLHTRHHQIPCFLVLPALMSEADDLDGHGIAAVENVRPKVVRSGVIYHIILCRWARSGEAEREKVGLTIESECREARGMARRISAHLEGRHLRFISVKDDNAYAYNHTIDLSRSRRIPSRGGEGDLGAVAHTIRDSDDAARVFLVGNQSAVHKGEGRPIVEWERKPRLSARS